MPPRQKKKVDPQDLSNVANLMRKNNQLILKSLRTVFTCFNTLDFKKYITNTNYFVRFQSNGVYRGSQHVLRPMSILWPSSYESMVKELSTLDAHLINTEFRERPIEWILKSGLATTPNCTRCKQPMSTSYQGVLVSWHCIQTETCRMFSMPIQRPSFFRGFEAIAIDKLLFAVYYWSICTPVQDLVSLMNISTSDLQSIWRRIQYVCKVVMENDKTKLSSDETVDLISVKFNDSFIACAKSSNSVKIGLQIPENTSNIIVMVKDWFEDGSKIRISEAKFLDLQNCGKFQIEMTARYRMALKNDKFDHDSASGYLLNQLTQIFKDFDSSTYSNESFRLVLAELEWREKYGKNPFDAFKNIVDHMKHHSELIPNIVVPNNFELPQFDCESYIWSESYFYASLLPVDSKGQPIYLEQQPDLTKPPENDIRLQCHDCNYLFDNFSFSRHIIEHVESKKNEQELFDQDLLVKCKHCFKIMKKDDILIHSQLFRSTLHNILYGCRICCVKFDSRLSFLEHMRRLHFEHEMPYACPSCPFKCSFQRDVFVHFQVAHRYSMVALCPLCLRSFTVADPKTMNQEKMFELSKIIYNHIALHYAVSGLFKCDNCCLCFVNKNTLLEHKKSRHNPMKSEIKTKNCKFIEYNVTKEEEQYCVKASASELFISNKRPNAMLSDDEDTIAPQYKINKFLEGGAPSIVESTRVETDITSEKMLELMSKFQRDDEEYVTDQDGVRLKCMECGYYLTVDHYVGKINCNSSFCNYRTYCPRASLEHKKKYHSTPDKLFLHLKKLGDWIKIFTEKGYKIKLPDVENEKPMSSKDKATSRVKQVIKIKEAHRRKQALVGMDSDDEAIIIE